MKKNYVLVSFLALIPRLLHLNAFLTADEFLWLERSRNFILALQHRNWAATFQTGHPGVTTMWAGSLGMKVYGFIHNSDGFDTFLNSLAWDNQPLDLITYVRVPIVLMVTLSIVSIVYLLSQLFNDKVAIISGILLALDPWYLAHSRVLHHDALMATFMTLAALSLLLYIKKRDSQWLLIISGVCAGLALLSKVLSAFLVIWLVILFGVSALVQKRSLVALGTDGAIWGLSAGLICFILWPATWLDPFTVMKRIMQMTTTYAINPHEAGQFFMGKTVADPGLWFYPVVMLFALTPLVLIGVAIFVTMHKSIADKRATHAGELSQRTILLMLVVYCALYMVFINIGEKKQDRYLLPALLMLNVIASLGIYKLYNQAANRWTLHKRLWYLTIACVVIAQGLTSLPQHPYYLTYYNPLAGGIRAAARSLAVGWGEGNDLAAHYLNQRSDHSSVTAVATMPTTFAPYFLGHTIPWSWEPYAAFTADYVVIYRREIQEGQLSASILNYIQENWSLEKTVEIQGLPYVWIYRTPMADWSVSENYKSEAILRLGLLAYRIHTSKPTYESSLSISLYRQCLTGTEVGEWRVNMYNEEHPPIGLETRVNLHCELNTIIEEMFYIKPGSDIPSGTYTLKVGFQPTGQPVSWLDIDELSQIQINIQ